MKRMCWMVLFFLFSVLLMYPAKVYAQTADYFVEASVDNTSPFYGQQITYRFKFYSAVVLPEAVYQPPDFIGFWRTEVTPTQQYIEQIDGRQYTVKELTTTLFPTQDGEIVISPSELVLLATVFRDEEVLRTNEIVIRVQPLPEPVPDNFSGAVGAVSMEARLDRQSIALDEVVQLTLTVQGNANLESLGSPEVQIPAGWRILPMDSVYQSQIDTVTQQLHSEKTFAWSLFPALIGASELSPLMLVYFNPVTQQYENLRTISVPLNVVSGDDSSLPPNSSPALTSELQLRPIKPTTLAPSYLDVKTTGLMDLLLWILPPLILALTYTVRMYRSRLTARSHASTVLKMVLRKTQGRSARSAFDMYFMERFNLRTGAWTIAEINTMLQAKSVSAEICSQISALLEQADTAQYAPAQGDSKKAIEPGLIRKALVLLDTELSGDA